MTIYHLSPFTNYPLDLQVHANCEMLGDVLQISFTVLGGDLSQLAWPDWHSDAGRVDELWQMSCFEFFVASSNQQNQHYCEGNFAPSGAWNLYSFADYRAKMQRLPIPAEYIPVRERFVDRPFDFRVSINKKLFTPLLGLKWSVGLATVLLAGGKKYYFALEHCKEEPDFHLRESFTLTI